MLLWQTMMTCRSDGGVNMSQGMFAYITVIFLIMSIVAYKFGYVTGRIEEREKIEKEQNDGEE